MTVNTSCTSIQVNEQKNAGVREEDQGKHHVHEPRGLLFRLKRFFGLQDGDKQLRLCFIIGLIHATIDWKAVSSAKE